MIKIIETHEKASDYQTRYEIEIFRDGKSLSSMRASDCLSECPEDATLGRDLSFIFNASDFFNIGLEAGKNGEEVIFETKYLDDDENEITAEEFNK